MSWLRLLRTRASASLTTWPGAAGWKFSGIVLALFGGFAVVAGLVTGFFTVGLTPLSPVEFTRAALILFIFPGIAEELIFRGLILPHRSENRSERFRRNALVASAGVFTLYHVVNAWLVFPIARSVFWDLRFLLIVVGLGWACGAVYLRTGSLWPAVLIHWGIVVAWKAFLGGPVFFS